MLSSIHPLGERTRDNRWWLTVSAFTVGAVAAGTAVAWAAASLGSLLLPAPAGAWAIGAVLAAAGVADLIGIRVPGPHRQVDERWIGAYRGWVYGLGFGAQLGVGLATYVVTFATWALVAASFLTASPALGAVFGAAFGLGRAVPLLAAGVIDRPTRLSRLHVAMARLGGVAHRSTAVAVLTVGLSMLVVGVAGVAP
jgi:hypothetical protein